MPLLNAYYNCWKHGGCWDDGSDSISIVADMDTATVGAGKTATFDFSLTASQGFADPVTLVLQDGPPNAIVSFSPNPVTLPGTSQLSVKTAVSTPAGTYTMTVLGVAGQVTDTVPLTLTVEPLDKHLATQPCLSGRDRDLPRPAW